MSNNLHQIYKMLKCQTDTTRSFS